MDEKINLKAVEQYCNTYSSKVLDAFFDKKDKISGPEILELCTIRQINLFVIHELFKTWKAETLKLKSPYFNFEAEPVKEALDALLTNLSNNILIDRKNLEPLMRRAVKNAMMVIVDPYDFYADMIEADETIDCESFKDQLKYLKINKAPLERLIQKIEEKGVSQLNSNEAFGMLDTILEEVNFTPEDLDEYLEKFSAVVPLSIESFYEPRKISVEPKTNSVREEVKAEVVKQPIVNVVNQQTKQKPTVNERLSHEPRPTLADNFTRIAKIKDSLTINQKFMFTKVLFHGDFELFSKAIDDLDRQDNVEGAMRYLEQNYEEWDRESEEFHEFMELVEKRFS